MGAVLEVNLAAITRNYALLQSAFTGSACGAVVKANAYGLGADHVAPALRQAGCQHFFVATLEEALAVRQVVPDHTIYVFHGVDAGSEKECMHARITPVLNSISNIERWLKAGGKEAALHVDTGMSRLGIAPEESAQAATLLPSPTLLMSHLAVADDPAHPQNRQQLARFQQAAVLFPAAKKSLVNSAGVFLGKDFHFDIARTGCALYGISTAEGTATVENVVNFTAPILQIREVKKGETVGYDATFTAKRDSRIAVIELGYADGYLRHLSNIGHAYIGDIRVPIAGRVSMDLITLDVTDIPELAAGARAELIGPHLSVNEVAEAADTIGYEIFTRFGRRIKRIYRGQ